MRRPGGAARPARASAARRTVRAPPSTGPLAQADLRCAEPACPVITFTETHGLAEPRALLTRRAADALSDDDTTVNALARRLDVDWYTLWEALKVEARRRAEDPQRLVGVALLGVDPHIW